MALLCDNSKPLKCNVAMSSLAGGANQPRPMARMHAVAVIHDLSGHIFKPHILGKISKGGPKLDDVAECLHAMDNTLRIAPMQHKRYRATMYCADSMDTPADALRRARIKRGYATAADAARAFGWNTVTYTSHENGTRGIKIDAAERYAKAFNIDVGQLLGLKAVLVATTDTSATPVLFESAFGVWRNKALDQASLRKAQFIRAPKAAGTSVMRYATRVADDSCMLSIQPNEYAIFEREDNFDAIKSGSLVVVERSRGDLVERSIRKLLKSADGSAQLVCDTTADQYDEVIDLYASDNVVLIGRVVGKYADL